MVSFSVVSLIAMVPESECRMPTLMVSCAWADTPVSNIAAAEAALATARVVLRTKCMTTPWFG